MGKNIAQSVIERPAPPPNPPSVPDVDLALVLETILNEAKKTAGGTSKPFHLSNEVVAVRSRTFSRSDTATNGDSSYDDLNSMETLSAYSERAFDFEGDEDDFDGEADGVPDRTQEPDVQKGSEGSSGEAEIVWIPNQGKVITLHELLTMDAGENDSQTSGDGADILKKLQSIYGKETAKARFSIIDFANDLEMREKQKKALFETDGLLSSET